MRSDMETNMDCPEADPFALMDQSAPVGNGFGV